MFHSKCNDQLAKRERRLKAGTKKREAAANKEMKNIAILQVLLRILNVINEINEFLMIFYRLALFFWRFCANVRADFAVFVAASLCWLRLFHNP